MSSLASSKEAMIARNFSTSAGLQMVILKVEYISELSDALQIDLYDRCGR